MSGQEHPSAAELADERSHLFALAYRMLGQASEADIVVRQTYSRWYALSVTEKELVAEPAAWLTNTTGRLCLTALASAKPVREQYPGEWLPEPLPDSVMKDAKSADAVTDRLTLDESVTMGLLVTLDSLTPAERVAFVLHDVFGLPIATVSTIVGRTPASTRSLAKAARRRIHNRQTQETKPDPDVHGRVVHELRLAAETGQQDALNRLLAPDARMLTDAGVATCVDTRTVEGAAEVAAKICGALTRDPTQVTEHEVNGQSGLILHREGRVTGVVSVNVRDGRVTDLWIVLNPDKLRHWNE